MRCGRGGRLGRSPPRPCCRECGHVAPALQEPARKDSLSLPSLLPPSLPGCRGSSAASGLAVAAAPPQRLPEPLPHAGPPPRRLRRRERAGNAGSAGAPRGSPQSSPAHGKRAGRGVPRVSSKVITPPYSLQLTAEFTAAVKMVRKNVVHRSRVIKQAY